MKQDVNGCSTCLDGEERYEYFTRRIAGHDVQRVQYDYRDHREGLFSCTAQSVEMARYRRDKWIAEHRDAAGEFPIGFYLNRSRDEQR